MLSQQITTPGGTTIELAVKTGDHPGPAGSGGTQSGGAGGQGQCGGAGGRRGK